MEYGGGCVCTDRDWLEKGVFGGEKVGNHCSIRTYQIIFFVCFCPSAGYLRSWGNSINVLLAEILFYYLQWHVCPVDEQ